VLKAALVNASADLSLLVAHLAGCTHICHAPHSMGHNHGSARAMTRLVTTRLLYLSYQRLFVIMSRPMCIALMNAKHIITGAVECQLLHITYSMTITWKCTIHF